MAGDELNMNKIKKYNLEDRFVAFIDILGFKDIVMNNKHPEKIIAALENAKEKITKRNSDVVTGSNYTLLNNEYTEDSLFPDFFYAGNAVSNLDIKELQYSIKGFEDLKITWFSDSLIISIKSDKLSNLLFLTEIIKNLQANLFNYKILLRGAITKGEFYHDDNVGYGKAMIEAYILESKKAIVPRIILSEDLIKHIIEVGEEEKRINITKYSEYDYYENLDDFQDKFTNIETVRKELLNYILVKDEDSAYFIDYLKPLLSDISFCMGRNHFEFPKMEFQLCRQFIQSEIRNNDMKISIKYIWLKGYFEKTLKNVEKLLAKSQEEFHNKTEKNRNDKNFNINSNKKYDLL